MHQHERTGGESAWEDLCWEAAALKMRNCWHGFYTEQLLHRRPLHKKLFTTNLLHGEACTQGGSYKQNLLHRETFTQERFYTQKLLHREVFIQSSLDTEKLAHTGVYTEKLRKSLYTQRL